MEVEAEGTAEAAESSPRAWTLAQLRCLKSALGLAFMFPHGFFLMSFRENAMRDTLEKKSIYLPAKEKSLSQRINLCLSRADLKLFSRPLKN